MKNLNNHLLNIMRITAILMLTILFTNCNDSTSLRSPGGNDAAPGQVSNVSVENRPGAAKITFSLPNSPSFLYVKAVYDIRPGKSREVKVSDSKNSLMVEGFTDTKKHTVKLYSVSRGENESKPKNVTVKPLESPLVEISNSLSLSTSFGGVDLSYTNTYGAQVAITLLAADSTGEVVPYQTLYTEATQGIFTVRGFSDQERQFGYFVRDKFQNFSDTVYVTKKPLLEEELDKSKFSNAALPTDQFTPYANRASNDINKLWDGKNGYSSNYFLTEADGILPEWFTIDLGQTAVLSRINLLQRERVGFRAQDPKTFELWGSQNPNPDGSFDMTWFKYGVFKSITPDGDRIVTTEERSQIIEGGENFEIPNAGDFPAAKFLRFKQLEAWGANKQVGIGELTIYGQIQ